MKDKEHCEEVWISRILRIAFAVIFGAAVFGKFAGGYGNYLQHMSGMFDGKLPGFLLSPYVHILPFAEILIVVWLLTGFKLRSGWIFTAFVLLTLGFGMMVAQQVAIASANFIYMFAALFGIYLSKYDYCCLGGCGCKK